MFPHACSSSLISSRLAMSCFDDPDYSQLFEEEPDDCCMGMDLKQDSGDGFMDILLEDLLS